MVGSRRTPRALSNSRVGASANRMADPIIFITGFPGFLAHYLLEKVLQTMPEARFEMLVESRYLGWARKAVERFEQRLPGATQRVGFIPGDIGEANLGLDNAALARLRAEVRLVYQLAAIYDLAVPEALARKTNVIGTQNLLDFCTSLDKLERLVYVSTCHVCGNGRGVSWSRNWTWARSSRTSMSPRSSPPKAAWQRAERRHKRKSASQPRAGPGVRGETVMLHKDERRCGYDGTIHWCELVRAR